MAMANRMKSNLLYKLTDVMSLPIIMFLALLIHVQIWAAILILKTGSSCALSTLVLNNHPLWQLSPRGKQNKICAILSLITLRNVTALNECTIQYQESQHIFHFLTMRSPTPSRWRCAYISSPFMVIDNLKVSLDCAWVEFGGLI